MADSIEAAHEAIQGQSMSDQEIAEYIESIPDEVLESMTFSVPWQEDVDISRHLKDEDGFSIIPKADADKLSYSFRLFQQECWNKFIDNPHINTSVRDMVGRLTGYGFDVDSDFKEVSRAIQNITVDPRNRLYSLLPKYVARSRIEGELFLVLTVHKNGFVEVDFRDPGTLGTGGNKSSGIIFHPRKPTMPLVYMFDYTDGNGSKVEEQIPSIYLAYYPSLLNQIKKNKDFSKTKLDENHSRAKSYSTLGGYYRFVISWDLSFLTARNVSHLRTTLKWVNHYENLKQYEIDHKKSAGAYLWAFKITDARAYKTWLRMTEEERKATGIMDKKKPGGSVVLPPGMELEVHNPNLTSINEQDTDILHMITSGLNQPEDVVTGSPSGKTYGAIQASRGPMSDRTLDEMAYFERFLRWDFWRPIFYLMGEVGAFKKYFRVLEVTDFNENQEPVKEYVNRAPWELVEITFPHSEVSDYESRANAFMGVKHGSLNRNLGIPNAEIARKMGFGNYRKLRLKKATEDLRFPELQPEVDQESRQEKEEGEPKKRSKPTSTDKDGEE